MLLFLKFLRSFKIQFELNLSDTCNYACKTYYLGFLKFQVRTTYVFEKYTQFSTALTEY